MTRPRLKSFLDGVVLPDYCVLLCHDANHNGDEPGGCGNPRCWKHDPAYSPKPHPIRVFTCRCPYGTFEGEN